jgi:hypothetical protein
VYWSWETIPVEYKTIGLGLVSLGLAIWGITTLVRGQGGGWATLGGLGLLVAAMVVPFWGFLSGNFRPIVTIFFVLRVVSVAYDEVSRFLRTLPF